MAEDSPQNICNICHDDVAVGEGETMACSHLYHTECYRTYINGLGLPRTLTGSCPEAKCPVCRVSEVSLRAAETELMNANGPVEVEDAGDTTTDADDDDNTLAQLGGKGREGKGKAKGQAEGKGTTKGQAEGKGKAKGQAELLNANGPVEVEDTGDASDADDDDDNTLAQLGGKGRKGKRKANGQAEGKGKAKGQAEGKGTTKGQAEGKGKAKGQAEGKGKGKGKAKEWPSRRERNGQAEAKGKGPEKGQGSILTAFGLAQPRSQGNENLKRLQNLNADEVERFIALSEGCPPHLLQMVTYDASAQQSARAVLPKSYSEQKTRQAWRLAKATRGVATELDLSSDSDNDLPPPLEAPAPAAKAKAKAAAAKMIAAAAKAAPKAALDSALTSASNAAVTDAPPATGKEYWCSLCGNQATQETVRVRSKKKQTYKCLKCCCKMTNIYRKGGTMNDIDKFTDDDVVEFFSADHSATGTLEKSFDRLMERHSNKEDFWEYAGEALPLSVWATRGFDVEMIKAKAKPGDITIHPTLGECYRIKIQKSGDRGATGKRSSATHSGRNSNRSRSRGRNSNRSRSRGRSPARSRSQFSASARGSGDRRSDHGSRSRSRSQGRSTTAAYGAKEDFHAMESRVNEKIKDAAIILKQMGKAKKSLATLLSSARVTALPKATTASAHELQVSLNNFADEVQQSAVDLAKNLPRNAKEKAETLVAESLAMQKSLEHISKAMSKLMKL
jgi:hypothetical protein